jgi:hypothetical protein
VVLRGACQVDEQTKALLDAQKAPKRLSVGAAPDAAAPSAASAGSAWNTGGTWEEKDMTSWAKEELEKRLKTVKAVDGALSAKVSKVKDVEGSASVVAVRTPHAAERARRVVRASCERRCAAWAVAGEAR